MASRSKVLYLFDVDGTLTRPRQVISDDLKSFLLNKVKPLVSIGLVSGSDYAKVAEQMSGADVAAEFDFVFCENGLVYYKDGELKSQESIVSHLGDRTLQKVINFALGYMSKIELPCKRGNFVEFRSGMINICPVGRSCNQIERENFALFDSVHKIRKKFVYELQREFSHYDLTFALGGQISVDVFPTGWDKTFCLKHVAPYDYEEIHFFGDKTTPGGNDYEIFYDDRVEGHRVRSPEDTKEQIMAFLNIE